jgi:threonine dehydrogenase-like Zn-dependent dehydrogenase
MGAKLIAITDILDERLDRARQCGVDLTINVGQNSPEVQALAKGEVLFDVTFGASGACRRSVGPPAG